jgi:hypothetical protein
MIFLYSLVMLALGAVTSVVQRRAAALGRAYARAALAVQNRLRETQFKPGNGNKPDACQLAKVQYELGWLVAKRDRVETRHFSWQLWAETLSRWVNNLANWKGKKLPYTFGAVDVWLMLWGIDALGVGEFVSARGVYELVAAWLTR